MEGCIFVDSQKYELMHAGLSDTNNMNTEIVFPAVNFHIFVTTQSSKYYRLSTMMFDPAPMTNCGYTVQAVIDK